MTRNKSTDSSTGLPIWLPAFPTICSMVFTIALCFNTGLSANAETQVSENDETCVDLRSHLLTLLARREFLQFQIELKGLLKPQHHAARSLIRDTAIAAALSSQVAEEVKKGNRSEVDALESLFSEVTKVRDGAVNRYRELSFSNLQLELRWREVEEQAHLQRNSSLAWSQIFASAIRCWWALTLVAILSFLLWIHEQRREIRQWRRSLAVAREPTVMALWWLIGLAIFCQGCGTLLQPLTPRSIWEDERTAGLAGEVQNLKNDVAMLELELGKLEVALTSINDEFVDEVADSRSVTGAVLASENNQTEHQRRVQELSLQIISLQFETRNFEQSSQLLADSIQKETNKIKVFQAQLPGQFRAMKQKEIAGIFGIAVLLLVPLELSVLRHWRHLRKHRRTCPRCLSENQLSPIKDGNKTLKLICKGEVRKGVRCAAEFTPEVQRRARLCFPTVGIIYSGKTKWIRSVEKQFERDMTDGPAQISLVTASNAGKLHTATKADEVPLPIVLRLNDGDFIPPRGQTLVMLFDYGGEMGMRSVTDAPKKRALFMDGFVLFLDPTRTRSRAAKSGTTLSIDDQVETARRFKEDLRAASEKIRGDRLDMPVAVCISKLDLLVNMNPLGGRAYEFLDKLRETQDEPITLDLIQRRSRLCTEYLRQMFDGWNIEQFLRTNFGERFMFFPLTPVNINQNELGRTDSNDEVEKRTSLPFGVQEPIWWLLHMYGYKVLTTETNRD